MSLSTHQTRQLSALLQRLDQSAWCSTLLHVLRHYDGLQDMLGYVDIGPWPEIIRLLRQLAKDKLAFGVTDFLLASRLAACQFFTVEVAALDRSQGKRIYWDTSISLHDWSEQFRQYPIVAWEIAPRAYPCVTTATKLLRHRQRLSSGYR